MFKSKAKNITPFARFFLTPSNSTHRQYEALRAYFVDGLSSTEAASRFGYKPESLRLMCHQFRKNPRRQFFLPPRKGPRRKPKQVQLREQVIAMRKKNMSIYDISQALKKERQRLSPVAVSLILKEEGFARLPRRKDEERPPGARPDAAAVADVRWLDLRPRRFHTKFAGLFLFLPYIAQIPLDRILARAGFPGTKMIPAGNAMRSLLALKLFGSARHSHVMSYVLDEGLPLIAGLNAIPKRQFLTEYSCRIHPSSYPKVMKMWFDAVGKLGLRWGVSFDVDFHTIPFHGEDALVEKHYISKRSRRQKGILAFLVQDAQRRVFCYGNADLRKDERNEEVVRFVKFWKQRTGHYPEELVFDSQLTTYANLNKLNKMGIQFITLRARPKNLPEKLYKTPPGAWKQVQLQGVARIYRTPRVLDEKITLEGYEGPIRQLTVTELGHEEPTLVLTNQLKRSCAKLIKRYAQRMIIENSIADGIDFFHMDALSSAVAMKVSCDLQLTLMASSLYRILGSLIGNGYETAKSRRIFRDFIDASGTVTITDERILVRFQRRAHNPLLLAAGFGDIDIAIPWLGGKRLRFIFK